MDTTAAPESGRLAAWLRGTWGAALVSGLGGFVVIMLLATLTRTLKLALLIAPFGASSVLLFALPQSPLARPRNVIGGHLVSATMGLLVFHLVGTGPIACGLGVGLAIMAMQLTGTIHPPAGANPLVVILAGGAGWSFLLLPVATGTVMLVAVAWLYHRVLSGRAYPAR